MRFNRQLIMNALYKGISGFTLFASIYVLINYLGDVSYGLWVLIFTLFQWILFMDFGITNVLKTKIPELSVHNERALIGAFIKASYKLSSIIAIALFLIVLLVTMLVDLKKELNLPYSSEFVNTIFLLNTAFFCLSFILSINKSLFVGVLQTHISEQSAALFQILFLLTSLFFLYNYPDADAEHKLYIISISNGLLNVATGLFYTILFFKRHSFPLFKAEKLDKNNIIHLVGFGSKFMLLQMLMIIIFSSDTYILASYLNTAEITRYDLVTKYFQFPMMIVISAMAYLWPTFAQKYSHGDADWIRTTMRNFNKIFVIIALLIIPFSMVCNHILSLWVGNDFTVTYIFILNVALMTGLRVYYAFYANFFNGIGLLRSQIILMGAGALFKIPLSYYLLQNGYAISSVIIATNLFLVMCCIALPIQSVKILKFLKSKG